MRPKAALFLLALVLPFVVAAPGFAQVGLPNLSEFTGAVSKVVAAPSKNAVARGVFKSGLAVPSVKPGETARGIGKMVQTKLEKATGPKAGLAPLDESMPRWLIAMEGELVKSGYAKRDAGVAYGFAFLELYKNATGKTVPGSAYQVALPSLATAIAKGWGAKYAALTPAHKEQVYESLVMDTALYSEFISQLEAAGKTEEVKSFRRASALLFENLVGVPPAQVTIASDGAITGLAPSKSKPVKP